MTYLIFDLDGTLVDSEPLSGRVFQKMLPELDGSVEEITQWCKGRKLADLTTELQNERGFSLSDDFIPRFREELARVFEDSLQPIDGAHDMLASITQPKCIASNGPLVKMQQSLRICGLQSFFENRIYSAYEIGSWKPAPGLFLHAAKEMRVNPQDCLVIEDSETGLQAATAAGMTVVHFAADGHSTQAHHIQHLSELPAMIEKLTG